MPKSRSLIVGAALCWISFVGVASAHALLLSFKLDGREVILHYNGRVDAVRSRLTLLDQDGANPQKLDCAAGDDLATLKSDLGDRPAGSYILHWEVLSVDGHLSRGDQPLALPAR